MYTYNTCIYYRDYIYIYVYIYTSNTRIYYRDKYIYIYIHIIHVCIIETRRAASDAAPSRRPSLGNQEQHVCRLVLLFYN